MEKLLLAVLLISEAIFICFMPVDLIDVLRKFEPIKGYRPFSPNWLTLYSIPIFLGGVLYYSFYENLTISLILIVAGMSLDRLDGKFASRKELSKKDGESLWNDLNYPGGTILGRSFDPLADKIRNISTIVLIGLIINLNLIENVIWWIVVSLIIISETGGTLIRLDYFNKFSSKEISANGIGKVKVFLQNTFIIIFFIYQDGWINFKSPLWMLLGAIIILSSISFLTKLKAVAKIPNAREFLSLFTALFSHKISILTSFKNLFIFFYKILKGQH